MDEIKLLGQKGPHNLMLAGPFIIGAEPVGLRGAPVAAVDQAIPSR